MQIEIFTWVFDLDQPTGELSAVRMHILCCAHAHSELWAEHACKDKHENIAEQYLFEVQLHCVSTKCRTSEKCPD